MNILPIKNNNNCQPNFGHAIRVSYCIKKPNAVGYDYVNPSTNKELYKKLNSKIIGWLNEGLINKVRELVDMPMKKSMHLSDSEAVLKENFISDLKSIDSDYKQFAYARSVYNRNKLGFIATGYDVPIIENLKGATEIGLAKSESILLYGTTHTDFVKEICQDFEKNSKRYIAHPLNRLLEDGKEVLLRLNFRQAGKDKKGKLLYEFDNYTFDRIKKPLPKSKFPEEVQVINLKNTPIMQDLLRDTVMHVVKQVVRNKEVGSLSDITEAILKPKSKKNIFKQSGLIEQCNQARKSKNRKVKNDPNQLKIPFVFEE